MSPKPDAKVVFLKQTRAGCPEISRCAARVGAVGCIITAGDRLSIYRVAATVPHGPVLVTDNTEFVFAS